ncbi:MAG TPA: RidA family protein, partial [Conexibacter sp.]|nr:RidA family protein [Conexibacter sp.]
MATFHSDVEGIAPTPLPYSQVVETRELVFTAGQVPFDADGRLVGDDILTQARQALANLVAVLAAAGCGPKDVVKLNCFLSDMADGPGWNEAYREVFEEPFPARATVGAQLAGFKIEIEAVAQKP